MPELHVYIEKEHDKIDLHLGRELDKRPTLCYLIRQVMMGAKDQYIISRGEMLAMFTGYQEGEIYETDKTMEAALRSFRLKVAAGVYAPNGRGPMDDPECTAYYRTGSKTGRVV